MDIIDRKLLNMLQESFPITAEPFHEIASELGIKPQEVLARVKALKRSGYIRRIGAVISGAKLGYTSILAAMEVPEELVAKVARVINKYSTVTHNYKREGLLNVWFTLSTQSDAERRQILQDIAREAEIEKIYEFPSVNSFKLNVFFDAGGGSN